MFVGKALTLTHGSFEWHYDLYVALTNVEWVCYVHKFKICLTFDTLFDQLVIAVFLAEFLYRDRSLLLFWELWSIYHQWRRRLFIQVAWISFACCMIIDSFVYWQPPGVQPDHSFELIMQFWVESERHGGNASKRMTTNCRFIEVKFYTFWRFVFWQIKEFASARCSQLI